MCNACELFIQHRLMVSTYSSNQTPNRQAMIATNSAILKLHNPIVTHRRINKWDTRLREKKELKNPKNLQAKNTRRTNIILNPASSPNRTSSSRDKKTNCLQATYTYNSPRHKVYLGAPRFTDRIDATRVDISSSASRLYRKTCVKWAVHDYHSPGDSENRDWQKVGASWFLAVRQEHRDPTLRTSRIRSAGKSTWCIDLSKRCTVEKCRLGVFRADTLINRGVTSRKVCGLFRWSNERSSRASRNRCIDNGTAIVSLEITCIVSRSLK